MYAWSKMRRFAISYLTVSVAIVLLANLTLIIFYLRQFGLHAQALDECWPNFCRTTSSLGDFIVVNGVLVGLLLVIWFVIVRLRPHRAADS